MRKSWLRRKYMRVWRLGSSPMRRITVALPSRANRNASMMMKVHFCCHPATHPPSNVMLLGLNTNELPVTEWSSSPMASQLLHSINIFISLANHSLEVQTSMFSHSPTVCSPLVFSVTSTPLNRDQLQEGPLYKAKPFQNAIYLRTFIQGNQLGPHSFSVSYDRFVAICCPLRYPVLMSPRLCLLLVVVSWLLGATDGLVQAGVTMSYRFCRSREVNHFFCEAPALVRLACDDTTVFESVMYVCCIVMLLIPFSVLMGSYGLILGTILRMRSIEAKKKTFTTCSSHLSVVGLFYGTTIYIYMRPSSYDSTDYDKVVSAFYTILTPVLNALIYSLKNREVLRALKRGLIDCRFRN
ncbi:olfactory receptor 2T12-like [Tachyglossus aculeatus]|uniref:olfactory receptor 2T12-like n=1 Tax=Tachyglossus aculeatus TaxID=9261 RepID=UPI0018F289AA|nr:olfactory receptor 2T12-like [Tachyglossus aculeatus]